MSKRLFNISTDPESLAARVTSTYPAGFEQSASNFEVDTFKFTQPPGTCLHFFGGALYFAVDNYVYCSKTFDVEHADIRYHAVAGFPGMVTMITSVTDGLYIGTTQGLYFLEGTGIVIDENYKVLSYFTERKVGEYRVIGGTAVKVDARLIPALQFLGIAALFASPLGIMAGLPGGQVVNLSTDKITLPDAEQGTAVFKSVNGLNQYIVCLDVAADLFVDGDTALDAGKLQDTWVLNTMTLTHTHYRGYPFNSLFRCGQSWYGCNKLGIFRIEGDTDFNGVPALARPLAAEILTPSFDFGKKEAKALLSLYVSARCDGEVAVDYLVNEVSACEDDEIIFDDEQQAHTLRANPPRGLRGVYWQFRLKNVEGSRFTALNLEPVLSVSAHRTR